MTTPVEIAFNYFKENQGELYRQYPDKFLVIKGHTVATAASTLDEAVNFTIENKMIPGEFIIQHCTIDDNAYTQTFHSRAVFA